jgi:hypothetical protein
VTFVFGYLEYISRLLSASMYAYFSRCKSLSYPDLEYTILLTILPEVSH